MKLNIKLPHLITILAILLVAIAITVYLIATTENASQEVPKEVAVSENSPSYDELSQDGVCGNYICETGERESCSIECSVGIGQESGNQTIDISSEYISKFAQTFIAPIGTESLRGLYITFGEGTTGEVKATFYEGHDFDEGKEVGSVTNRIQYIPAESNPAFPVTDISFSEETPYTVVVEPVGDDTVLSLSTHSTDLYEDGEGYIFGPLLDSDGVTVLDQGSTWRATGGDLNFSVLFWTEDGFDGRPADRLEDQ